MVTRPTAESRVTVHAVGIPGEREMLVALLREFARLRHRARTNPLEDRIKGLAFMKSDREGYSQLWRLYQTKGITPEEKRVVERMLRKKRAAMFSKEEGTQVREVEAQQ